MTPSRSTRVLPTVAAPDPVRSLSLHTRLTTRPRRRLRHPRGRGDHDHRVAERCLRPRPRRRGVPFRRRDRQAELGEFAVPAAGQRLAGRRGLGRQRLHRPAEPQRHHAEPALARPGADPRSVGDDLGVRLRRRAGPVQRRPVRVRGRDDPQGLGPRGQGRTRRRRHRRQRRHPADRHPEPVERPRPLCRGVGRDRVPGPELGRQLPDRQLRARPSARWPRSPPAGRTSRRPW